MKAQAAKGFPTSISSKISSQSSPTITGSYRVCCQFSSFPNRRDLSSIYSLPVYHHGGRGSTTCNRCWRDETRTSRETQVGHFLLWQIFQEVRIILFLRIWSHHRHHCPGSHKPSVKMIRLHSRTSVSYTSLGGMIVFHHWVKDEGRLLSVAA